MIENIGAYSKVDYDRGYQQGRTDEREKVIDFILDKISIRCEDCKFYNNYSNGVRCGCTDIQECNSKIKAYWLEELKEIQKNE